MTNNRLPKGFEVVETADTPVRFMILYQGYQWGQGPYDKSGCSAQTWETRSAAIEAILLFVKI